MIVKQEYNLIPVEFDEYDINDLLDVVFEQQDCKDRLQRLQQEEDPQELDFC